MLAFYEWMNQQHCSIRFTREEESDNKLAFLDVLVTREADGSLTTSVFRKATFSGLYLQWDSYVPKQYKRSLVHCLINRAWRICSNHYYFHQELLFLKNILKCNGYPSTFIDSCVNRFLSQHYEEQNIRFGPKKKSIFLCLPYAGIRSDKVRRQLSRLLSAVVPWASLKVVFKPSLKLSVLSKVKSKDHVLLNSNVVYKVDCNDCDKFYIGMTTRRLVQRLREHQMNNSSAIFRHFVNDKHNINFNNPCILAKDSYQFRLLIKESLLIKEHRAYASLNGNAGSTHLNLW